VYSPVQEDFEAFFFKTRDCAARAFFTSLPAYRAGCCSLAARCGKLV